MLFFGLCFSVAFGCAKKDEFLHGSGVQSTTSRPVPAFSRLWVGSLLDVRVVVAPGAPTLEVKGDDNLLDHVTARLEGGVLKLDTDAKVKTTMPLELGLRTEGLESVVAAAASNVSVQGLKAQAFKGGAAGAGRLTVAGSARDLDLTGAFAGQLDFTKVAAASAKVRTDKAANVRLGYLEALDVSATGASRVFYQGDPRITKNVEPSARLVGER